MKSAILVDGSYFIKRYRMLYPDWQQKSEKQVARDLYGGLLRDLRYVNRKIINKRELYRIFYYDCPPLEKRVENPVTKKGFTFARTREALFRKQFHQELKCLRKVALRLGRIADDGHWIIRPEITKDLLAKKITVDNLTEKDVKYEARQKGVDMKIGLDISSLAYKKAVDQIILIAGDSDFVPAAKLARREGIDFILDPMRNNINHDLHEHIDGLISHTWPSSIK
ncbi:MAG: NYN domain-containing protein [Nitrosomonas sp. PRO4]|nr:NYN domain-containing protein [Nitrosomonas sp. PRO4]